MPHSISEKLNQLGTLNFYEIIFPWVIILIIFSVSLYALKNTKNKLLRLGVFIVIFYSLTRVILFENPAAWMGYRYSLTWKEIGFREATIIDQNLRRYISPPQNLKYLAIGSSQTGAVFSDYAQKHRDFYKIEYSGMGPLDYYLYSELVKQIKPKTLILFLSEFDFGRDIVKETMVFAPHQSLSKHYFLIDILSNELGTSSAIHLSIKMLLADLFPEYKYQFLFKGLRDKLLNKHFLLKTQEQAFSSHSAQDKATEQVDILLRTLNKKPIDLNFRIYEQFLLRVLNSDIKLVVVEGQYHPGAYSVKNKKLKAIVSSKMQELSRKYKFQYITTDKFPILLSEDFADGYHPNKIGSDKIVNTLIPILDGNAQFKP